LFYWLTDRKAPAQPLTRLDDGQSSNVQLGTKAPRPELYARRALISTHVVVIWRCTIQQDAPLGGGAPPPLMRCTPRPGRFADILCGRSVAVYSLGDHIRFPRRIGLCKLVSIYRTDGLTAGLGAAIIG
jgi:hypothetical protein